MKSTLVMSRILHERFFSKILIIILAQITIKFDLRYSEFNNNSNIIVTQPALFWIAIMFERVYRNFTSLRWTAIKSDLHYFKFISSSNVIAKCTISTITSQVIKKYFLKICISSTMPSLQPLYEPNCFYGHFSHTH